MQFITWRRTDTFSWGTAQPFSLPAGAWTAVASLRHARTPNAAPQAFGIVVTLADGGVDPSDASRHLFDMLLHAEESVVAAWPKAKTAGELIALVGSVTFTDGVGVVSTDEFTLQERP